MLAVLGASRLVDAADVGVLEPRQRVRLALEHPHPLLVDELPAADDLDRDPAPGVLLLGFVDHTHPAFAEF